MAVELNKRPVLFENLAYYNTKDKEWTQAQIEAAISAGTLTIDNTRSDSNYAAVYDFYNGSIAGLSAEQKAAKLIGTINIPKDMVVSSGEVVTLTANQVDGLEAGTYIKLTLANATNDELYINAASLVDVYTAAQNASQVQLVITGHEISAGIVAGSITATEIANGAVTTDKLGAKAVTAAKIDDGAVGTTQLASDVVTSLGKADTAVQSVVASDASTGTDGTITVDGGEVAVKGYSTLASTVAGLSEISNATIANSDIDGLFEDEESNG